MASRDKLSEELHTLLGSDEVYYQSPMSKDMSYPCIVYSLSDPDIKYADNSTYFFMARYQIIYIDSNPDNDMVERMLGHFSRISSRAPYISDNLYHYPFDLYY